MFISSYEIETSYLGNKRKVTLYLNDVSAEDFIKLGKLCNPGDPEGMPNIDIIPCTTYFHNSAYNNNIIKSILRAENSVYGLTSAKFASYWKENKNMVPYIKKVIFNDPATIVFWADGTKTVAKAHGDDKFDKEIGLTVCIAKKAMGNKAHWDKVFKKWIK